MRMLCAHGFQPSLSPFMDFYWPVRSLWPGVRPLLCQRDRLQRNMQELHNNLELMGKLQHKILAEMERVPASAAIQPVSYKLEKEGESFALTLDTKDFSPEELAVKQVGRKLMVSGKKEKKQEDGEGSYSYRCQVLRQEFDLPEGVDPEVVTCSLAQDRRLHIHVAKPPSAEEAEREVPIRRSLEKTPPQSLSSQIEGSTTD